MSEWTTDNLKEAIYRELAELRGDIDRRFAGQEKNVETAFAAAKEAVNQTALNAKEAVTKSEVGVEKRSDAVYVTITKLTDALAAVMPRAEAEQRFSALSDKIDELKTSNSIGTGKTQGSELTIGKIYAAIAAVGAVLGILVLLANGMFK